MTAYTFFAEGDPVSQGSMSVFKGRTVHSNSAKLKVWRTIVHEAAAEAGLTPLPLPVGITLRFYLKRPRTVSRSVPSVKPDIDKLARAVLDAMTGVAYDDDSQVIQLTARKVYGPTAGVDVRVAYLYE